MDTSKNRLMDEMKWETRNLAEALKSCALIVLRNNEYV